MPLALDLPATAITRTNLRDAAKDRLRALIVTGGLAPRANVVERDLSERIGVSRTPLREALLALQGEGLLVSHPGRGFFVADLSVDEARELYPLIATLEAMAVRRGRPADVSGLRDLNMQFRRASSPSLALAADRNWHEALIARCAAPRTAALLTPLRVVAARYEYRYFSGAAAIRASAEQHDQVIQLLERGRVPPAASLLEKNWEQGLQWVEKHFAQ
jgi:DNA-binding GntR family transcriptional regulator